MHFEGIACCARVARLGIRAVNNVLYIDRRAEEREKVYQGHDGNGCQKTQHCCGRSVPSFSELAADQTRGNATCPSLRSTSPLVQGRKLENNCCKTEEIKDSLERDGGAGSIVWRSVSSPRSFGHAINRGRGCLRIVSPAGWFNAPLRDPLN